MPGPRDSEWEQGTYRVRLTFGREYPLVRPEVRFIPALPHPNVFRNGVVCLSLPQESTSVKELLLAIQQFLKEAPNLASPANAEQAALYQDHYKQYLAAAQEFARGQVKMV